MRGGRERDDGGDGGVVERRRRWGGQIGHKEHV